MSQMVAIRIQGEVRQEMRPRAPLSRLNSGVSGGEGRRGGSKASRRHRCSARCVAGRIRVFCAVALPCQSGARALRGGGGHDAGGHVADSRLGCVSHRCGGRATERARVTVALALARVDSVVRGEAFARAGCPRAGYQANLAPALRPRRRWGGRVHRIRTMAVARVSTFGFVVRGKRATALQALRSPHQEQ